MKKSIEYREAEALAMANAGALQEAKQALSTTKPAHILESIDTWKEIHDRFGNIIPEEVYERRLFFCSYFFATLLPSTHAMQARISRSP